MFSEVPRKHDPDSGETFYHRLFLFIDIQDTVPFLPCLCVALRNNQVKTWSISKIMEFINTTEVYTMLISKEDLQPIEIITVVHNYSSDAESTD